jgi:hypothetical protein
MSTPNDDLFNADMATTEPKVEQWRKEVKREDLEKEEVKSE